MPHRLNQTGAKATFITHASHADDITHLHYCTTRPLLSYNSRSMARSKMRCGYWQHMLQRGIDSGQKSARLHDYGMSESIRRGTRYTTPTWRTTV